MGPRWGQSPQKVPQKVRQGRLWIGSAFGAVIRRNDFQSGIIERVAGNGQAGFSGDGGPALEAQIRLWFDGSQLATDSQSNLYFLNWDLVGNRVIPRRVRKVDNQTGTPG